jgi:hypothetical protein
MQVPTEQRQALVVALTHDREAALRGFYGGVARSDQVGRIVASSLRMPAETWLSYLLANTVQAIRDGGRALAVPVLLQASSILLPPGADEKTRLAEGGFEHVRDLTVDHFPGAMHWIHWEDARGWRASFDRFLARLP